MLETGRSVGCENDILFAPFPCRFSFACFVVGKCSLLYEFTKNTVKAPALQSADNAVVSAFSSKPKKLVMLADFVVYI